MSGMLSVKDVDVSGKRVIVRMDLDVPVTVKPGEGVEEVEVVDGSRIEAGIPTLQLILDKGASQVVVIGHLGDEELSTFAVMPEISKRIAGGVSFWGDSWSGIVPNIDEDGQVHMLENLRMHPGEKQNDSEFAMKLSGLGDIYVNEAFSVAHRTHTSISALPKLMKAQGKIVCAGERFVKEIEMLAEVLNREGRKVLVIGGAKVTDKEKYARELADRFDVILKGGLLEGSPKREDGLDITDDAIEKYKKEIESAQVLVVAGVMGKYEDPRAEKGTKEILEAIGNSSAYKVAGGGDAEAAISKYGLSGKFDWISVGGGAMLEFLARGTLPGIEALN